MRHRDVLGRLAAHHQDVGQIARRQQPDRQVHHLPAMLGRGPQGLSREYPNSLTRAAGVPVPSKTWQLTNTTRFTPTVNVPGGRRGNGLPFNGTLLDLADLARSPTPAAA